MYQQLEKRFKNAMENIAFPCIKYFSGAENRSVEVFWGSLFLYNNSADVFINRIQTVITSCTYTISLLPHSTSITRHPCSVELSYFTVPQLALCSCGYCLCALEIQHSAVVLPPRNGSPIRQLLQNCILYSRYFSFLKSTS